MPAMTDNGMQFSFDNPVELKDTDLQNALGLDFDFGGKKEEEVPKKEEVKKEEEKTEPKVNTEKSAEKEPLDPKEEEEEEEEELPYAPDEQLIAGTINYLANEGIVKESYEGFDEDELTPETMAKLIKFNLEKEKEEDFQQFVDGLSPITKRILEFDLNSDPKQKDKIQEYLSILIEENNIKSLDPEVDTDQEKIVSKWYSSKEGYTPEEIKEKISELKNAGLIEKEAKRLKPKLDVEVKQIAEREEQERAAVKEAKEAYENQFATKMVDVLKAGNLSGISLDKGEATSLFNVLTATDVPVTFAGQQTTMPYLDAIISFHKYHEKGSPEILALAALLLTNKEKFDSLYEKKAETKVTKDFVAQHKFNNNIKAGKVQPTKEEPAPRWNRKF